MTTQCAVSNNNMTDHWTCFSYEELLSIAMAFNHTVANGKVCHQNVCLPKIPIDISPNKQILWNNIYNRLKPLCQYEYCWVDLKFVNNIADKKLRESVKYFVFKPKLKQWSSWLGTEDINFVLGQYSEALPYFKFIGALPSDFYTIRPFDASSYSHFKFIGFVLNHDTHDQKGSHWVALLIDNVHKAIEFFDSVGDRPPKHISRFIKMLLKMYKGYTFVRNKVVHQRKNSECGVYSIYFIIRRISGDSFSQITNTVIKDNDMKKFRSQIFLKN